MPSVASRGGARPTGTTRQAEARGPEGFSDGYRQGFLAALSVAALGLLLASVLTLVAWATAPHAEAGVLTAFRTAGRLWLSIHGIGLSTWVGAVEIVPLGGSLSAGALLFLAVSRAARSGDAGFFRRRRLIGLTSGLLGGYCLSAFTVAVLVNAGVATAFGAAWGAALLAGTALLLGLLRAERVGAGFVPGLPTAVRRTLLGAVGGLSVLLIGGMLLAGATMAVAVPEITAATGQLQAGGTGNVLLIIAQVCYLPVLAVWAAAVAVGPGFALGPGSLHLSGSSITETPAVPLLTALPTSGQTPALAWLALLVPVAAGLCCAFVVRRAASSRWAAVRLAGVAGLLAGIALGALCLPASGALAPGFYAQVGPSVVPVGLAAAAELALVAMAAAAWSWRAAVRAGVTAD